MTTNCQAKINTYLLSEFRVNPYTIIGNLQCTATQFVSTMVTSFKDISGEVVTLEVGASKSRHTIHRDFLIKESRYFRAMFEGPWKEATGGTIPLPLANPAIMPYFLDWLYSGLLPSDDADNVGGESCSNCGKNCKEGRDRAAPTLNPDELTEDDNNRLEAIIETLYDSHADLYIFADQFDFPRLRQALINLRWGVVIGLGAIPSYSHIIKSFRQLASSSPMCRLLIDAYVFHWDPSWDTCPVERELRSKLPSIFNFLLVAKLGEKGQNPQPPYIGPLCDYHEHAKDESSMAACAKALSDAKDKFQDVSMSWAELEEKRCTVDDEDGENEEGSEEEG